MAAGHSSLAKGTICKHAFCDPRGAKPTHSSAQEQQQLDGQGGAIASKDRIYKMKSKNIVVTRFPATFYHSLVKNPFVSQRFHSAEDLLCSDTGVCRYPQAASGGKNFFQKLVRDF